MATFYKSLATFSVRNLDHFVLLPKPTYAANVHLAIYASTIGASLAFVPKQNLKYNKHTLSMNKLSTFTAVEPFNISLLGS